MALPVFLLQLKAMILAQVSHIQGFMQLLMKQRNGKHWSAEDKTAILSHLRQLRKSLPMLAIFSLPGGSLLLPFLAWFLERRKKQAKQPLIPAATKEGPNQSVETMEKR